MTTLDQHTDVFLAAAEAFVALADRIPRDAYARPALGEWSVQDLLGHTGRALRTVVDCLAKPGTSVEVLDAAAYYRAIHRTVDPAEIQERGVGEGALLAEGTAPLHDLLAQATTAVEGVENDDAVVGTRVGGMRLGTYLATRILELTVHSLDLSRATGVPAELPADALRVTVQVLTDLAMSQGSVEQVVLALSGREPLPTGYGVL